MTWNWSWISATGSWFSISAGCWQRGPHGRSRKTRLSLQHISGKGRRVLKLKNINTYYGKVHALKNVSIHLAEKEIVALIGANGAGKSTILNTLSGITPARSGSIDFRGEPVN